MEWARSENVILLQRTLNVDGGWKVWSSNPRAKTWTLWVSARNFDAGAARLWQYMAERTAKVASLVENVMVSIFWEMTVFFRPVDFWFKSEAHLILRKSGESQVAPNVADGKPYGHLNIVIKPRPVWWRDNIAEPTLKEVHTKKKPNGEPTTWALRYASCDPGDLMTPQSEFQVIGGGRIRSA